MKVDEHIAEAIWFSGLADKATPLDRRAALSAQATAHATIATALLARYPGYDYAGCTPGEYEGKDIK